MRIILTNDDGYDAPGIAAMARALTQAGHEVRLSAPDRENSAVSHGISITRPLRARKVTVEGCPGWGVDGTPTDAARLGLHLLKDWKPDACVSGVNRGPNLGGACIYSGTVNSAMEASMAGCPALAVSLDSFTWEKYDTAAALAVRVLDWMKLHPLRRGEIYNLNVPAREDVKGVFFTQTLAPEFLTDANYQEFTSHYNNTYFFLDDGENPHYFPDDCDKNLVKQGWASLSALTWDIAARREGLPGAGEISL
ncbi:MAG: 5'/3'-nucleotidase SurE [Clostridiales bacterium]|nr:5'/3'-nucleotidase SurE [Clostridiales bacterium]